MSRTAKGPRLWLKPEERDKVTGKLRKRSVWWIRDGDIVVVTGCPPQDRPGAEKALAAYITEKYQPARDKERPLRDILVTDVLTVYGEDVAPKHARPEKTAARLIQLGTWWDGKAVSAVDGKSVREYGAWRKKQAWKSAKPAVPGGKKPRMVTDAGVRRELEDLQAALNHYLKEGHMREVVKIPLPPKSVPKERYLERDEAARLLRTMLHMPERQTVRRGPRTGQVIETAKRPARHLARFFLVGIYTGTRAAAICGAAFAPTPDRGWVDLKRGVFHRRKVGATETKKRQPPVRLPNRLLTHIRRWAATPRKDGTMPEYVVEFRGKPVGEVNKGFAAVVAEAGLGPDVTPHTLRHTCATWMMQAGVDLWQAAAFLGMTVQILESTYGHHRPDFQAEAASALDRGRRGAVETVDVEDAFTRRAA